MLPPVKLWRPQWVREGHLQSLRPGQSEHILQKKQLTPWDAILIVS